MTLLGGKLHELIELQCRRPESELKNQMKNKNCCRAIIIRRKSERLGKLGHKIGLLCIRTFSVPKYERNT